MDSGPLSLCAEGPVDSVQERADLDKQRVQAELLKMRLDGVNVGLGGPGAAAAAAADS